MRSFLCISKIVLLLISNIGFSHAGPFSLARRLLGFKDTNREGESILNVFKIRGGSSEEKPSKLLEGPCVGIDLGTTYRFVESTN